MNLLPGTTRPDAKYRRRFLRKIQRIGFGTVESFVMWSAAHKAPDLNTAYRMATSGARRSMHNHCLRKLDESAD